MKGIWVFCALTTAAMGLAPLAQADGTEWSAPANPGCEQIHWGLFGMQRRIICDGPKRPDGSWTRVRIIGTPAHYVPGSTYCGSYSCSSSDGYYVGDTIQAKETYVVFDYNVLPDEPGWLPPGTDVIR